MTVTMATATGTQKDIEDTLAKRGYEVAKPEPTPPAEEPLPEREAFESDEDHEAAVDEWNEKQRAAAEAADDEAAEAEAGNEEGDETGETTPKKPSKFAKRIKKFTAPLEKQIEELKAEVAAAKTGNKAGEPAAAVEPNPRPQRDGYKTVQEYEDALLKWGTAKAIEEQRIADAQATQKAASKEIVDSYLAGVATAQEKYEDFDEVLASDIPLHPIVRDAIIEERELGAEVAYYLGKHPDYALKLAQMPPLSAVKEVGRLSAKLKPASGSVGRTAGSGANQKPKPKVPAPVRPVNSSALTSTQTPAAAAKAGDLRAFRAARMAGR